MQERLAAVRIFGVACAILALVTAVAMGRHVDGPLPDDATFSLILINMQPLVSIGYLVLIVSLVVDSRLSRESWLALAGAGGIILLLTLYTAADLAFVGLEDDESFFLIVLTLTYLSPLAIAALGGLAALAVVEQLLVQRMYVQILVATGLTVALAFAMAFWFKSNGPPQSSDWWTFFATITWAAGWAAAFLATFRPPTAYLETALCRLTALIVIAFAVLWSLKGSGSMFDGAYTRLVLLSLVTLALSGIRMGSIGVLLGGLFVLIALGHGLIDPAEPARGEAEIWAFLRVTATPLAMALTLLLLSLAPDLASTLAKSSTRSTEVAIT